MAILVGTVVKVGGAASMVWAWATDAVWAMMVEMSGWGRKAGVGAEGICPLEELAASKLIRQMQQKLTITATE